MNLVSPIENRLCVRSERIELEVVCADGVSLGRLPILFLNTFGVPTSLDTALLARLTGLHLVGPIRLTGGARLTGQWISVLQALQAGINPHDKDGTHGGSPKGRFLRKVVEATAWAHLDGTTKDYDVHEQRLFEVPVVTDKGVCADEVETAVSFFLNAVSSSPSLPHRGNPDTGFFKFFDVVVRATERFLADAKQMRASWRAVDNTEPSAPVDKEIADTHSDAAMADAGFTLGDVSAYVGGPTRDRRDTALRRDLQTLIPRDVSSGLTPPQATAIVDLLTQKFPQIADLIVFNRVNEATSLLFAAWGSTLAVSPVPRDYFRWESRELMREALTKLVGETAATSLEVRVPREVELKRDYDKFFHSRNVHVPVARSTEEDPATAVVDVEDFVLWMFSRMAVALCLKEFITVCTEMGKRPRLPLSLWWDATLYSERYVRASFALSQAQRSVCSAFNI